jgi:CRISPR-associated protein Cmr3
MATIQLEALDTLFFKDGKPFSMGEDTQAEGQFPPSPSVIYGALRSAYIAQNLENGTHTLDELIALSENLIITNIVYKYDTNICYPLPLDYAERKSKENEAVCLKLTKNTFSGVEQQFLCIANEYVEQVNDGLIESSQFGSYLDGGINTFEIKKWSKLITNESKYGNSRNNETRSTSDDDGNVYRVGMRRLESSDYEKLRIIIEYDFTESIKLGLVKLGAEGKVAIINKDDSEIITALNFSDKYFKIVLLSPALFVGGSEPSHNLFNELGYEIKVLTKVVGKSIKIGGWDMVSKQPKQMLSAAPSGSVYYYEITNDKTVRQLNDDLAKVHSISDYRQKEGFGLYRIANLHFNPITL